MASPAQSVASLAYRADASAATLRAGANLPAPRSAVANEISDNTPFSAAALPAYFETLSTALGPLGWWPARTPFEVIVGAILVQNTTWTNVERALQNLRRARLLTPRAIERVPAARLAELVRPSGYFRQKAKKLKAFVRFLRTEHHG